MKNIEREELLRLKLSVTKYYKSRCFVCHESVKTRPFQYHHRWYLPDERIYSDFKKPNGNGKLVLDTLEYHKYLIPLIQQEPRRFLLVCWKHHQSIERLKRFSKVNFQRLVKAVKMSR